MNLDVKLETIEAVNCKFHGLISIAMCMKCPYFGGFAGFKKISCKRRW